MFWTAAKQGSGRRNIFTETFCLILYGGCFSASLPAFLNSPRIRSKNAVKELTEALKIGLTYDLALIFDITAVLG